MTCHSTTSKGNPCRARALLDSRYCYFHDPGLSQQRRANQRRGGQGRRLPVFDLSDLDFDFAAPEKTAPLLEALARKLLAGQLDAKTAHAVCHAVQIALRSNEIALNKRLVDQVERLSRSKRGSRVDPAEVQDLLRFEPSAQIEMQKEIAESSNKASGEN